MVKLKKNEGLKFTIAKGLEKKKGNSENISCFSLLEEIKGL